MVAELSKLAEQHISFGKFAVQDTARSSLDAGIVQGIESSLSI